MGKEKVRDLRLDLIRIFSLFCVICVHFFLNTGYYNNVVIGKRMAFMTIIRSFFMICVPMFITLTGYLMCNKKLSCRYYKGIIKIIVTYVLCSIVYLFFLKYYSKESISFSMLVVNILSYRGVPNAWYVEMYIGLFIFIPFLNMICNSIEEKKHFKLLLFTLLFLISFPGLLNIYKFDSISWWHQPSIDDGYVKIFPAWWTGFYPLLYYFAGAYIRKYSSELNIKLLPSLFFLSLVVLINGVFSYYRSYNSQFIWGGWNNYDSLFVFIQTFLVFNIILKFRLDIKSKRIIGLFKVLSDSCFGGYLLSYIFDFIIYARINQMASDAVGRFKYIPVVFIIFVLSLLSSILIERIRIILFYLSDKLYKKCKLIKS